MESTHYSTEFIVKFVREALGDEQAERVKNDPEALLFWDAKIQDWATD